jgi:hypothetical protein
MDQYVNQLYITLDYSNAQFDKNVLFIASGALGISFAFIENIVPDLGKAICKDTLTCSWYFFASVIFLSLLSHFISSLSIKWVIIHLGKKNEKKGRKIWNNVIRSLNVLMMIGLFLGIIFLINFIQLNI